ncbi:MAG: hypothetical protein ABL897_14355, partial [Hyphomicrobium sp.]
MADDTKDRRSSGQASDPVASATAGKRPYATLDLKATEIKITAVPDNSQSYAYSAARGYTVPKSDSASDSKTPGPAPASTYAMATPSTAASGATSKAANEKATASVSASSASASTTKPTVASAAAAAPPSPAKSETVVVKKRGGFFSHMTAGIIGGVLALAGSEWA